MISAQWSYSPDAWRCSADIANSFETVDANLEQATP
jgi:hypothetical protein